MDPKMIPALDPNPLPAPYWVFKLLLLVTFFLHILAMNFLLGGAVLALVAKWGNRQHGAHMFADIAKKLPSFLPATITIGIAPLLFLQVLYGQFFYTSTIIMGWPWFLVLVFLTIAYYGYYYASFKGVDRPKSAGNVMILSVVLTFVIGFIYSNNITLSQSPSRWAGKYFGDRAGWNLNLSEPTLVPRFLHFFVAAIAVGGLLLVFLALAKWKTEVEYSRSLFTLGGKAFMYATMAQYLIGSWFFMAMPREMRLLFMGDSPNATALLVLGVGGGLGAIFLMSAALRREEPHQTVYFVAAFTAVVILAMVIARDVLRGAYLRPYFHPEGFIVRTQWSVFPLFLILFVGGLILWLVMLKRFGLFSGTKPMEGNQ